MIKTFIIQCRDLEEGNGARWFDLKNSNHPTREAAIEHLRRIRATDDEESLCMYRIVEYLSDDYFRQPQDALEYQCLENKDKVIEQLERLKTKRKEWDDLTAEVYYKIFPTLR